MLHILSNLLEATSIVFADSRLYFCVDILDKVKGK